MTRKAFLTLLCLAVLLVGCGATAKANSSSSQVVGNANIIVVATSSTTVANSGGPTDTPTATETQPPAMTPTIPASTGNHQCNSGGCDNPWGYVIGLNGTEQGDYLYTAPSGFCAWFACIANFPNGKGYIVECFDGDMSKSGGIVGSCSKHGGEWEPLYKLISGSGPATPTPTPQPTAKPTATPTPRMTPTPLPTATP